MSIDVTAFDEQTAKRIISATKHMERRFNGLGFDSNNIASAVDPGPPMAMVTINSGEPVTSGGYYSGTIVNFYQSPTDLFTPPYLLDTGDLSCRVFEINQGSLIVGLTYIAFIIQTLNGEMIAVTTATGGQVESYYPTCDTSGSSGGVSATDPTCAVWYTNYLHIASVSVSVGQSVAPGQQIGNVAVHKGGAHLHFALGDGDPLIFPGYVVPISGQSIPITDWLGYPVVGPHANCQRGPMKATDFTGSQLSFIQSMFAPPVQGANWLSVITSPEHCDYDYYAVDLAFPPVGSQECAGQPVYNAIAPGTTSVLTTVESIARHPIVGFAVLLRHQKACCFDPNDTTDPHAPPARQFPGIPKSQIPQYPPSGTPYPYQPGSFSPVTRICLGFIPPLSVVGNPFAYPTQPAYFQLDPTQFEINNKYLRIKPALLVGAGSGSSGTGEVGQLPLTFEKTEVTIPAGMLVGGTTCTPPSTRCCDGPVDPCPSYDPVLPITITGPFGVACAEVTLTGQISYDDGAWSYEGFVNGEDISAAGIVANVQMDLEVGVWVAHVQFIGLGDTLLTEVDIPVATCGDGTILCGSQEVSRATCMGLMTVQVGNPCVSSSSGGGSGSGSGSGSGGGTLISVPCCSALVPSNLTLVDVTSGTTYPITYSSGIPGIATGWVTGTITIPGCGHTSLVLYCQSGSWHFGSVTGSSPLACVVAGGSGFPVTGCGSSGGTLLFTISATFTTSGGSTEGPCGCSGTSRTFTIHS